ncbi:hypothetical protein GQ53DRAFT_828555 [Thozetella sp. PMI_491]|nr:hypothetical protein GQ53DRAFT_828555 [Thozetella sp. PMI_491]
MHSSPRLDGPNGKERSGIESQNDEEKEPRDAATNQSTSETKKQAGMGIVPFLGQLLVSTVKNIADLLGLQTTAWFLLVCATTGSGILTAFAVQQPPSPTCPPQMYDSSYYMGLSQSVLAVCSLYFLFVPFLRSYAVPVRILFYIAWLVGLGTSIAAPMVYVQSWQNSLWLSFGSAASQAAASAFLFERIALKKIQMANKAEMGQESLAVDTVATSDTQGVAKMVTSPIDE